MKIYTLILLISLFLVSFEKIGYSPNSKLITMVPIYRLLGPQGYHFYTTDEAEKTTVIANLGFKEEGILGYAYKEPVQGSAPLYRFNGLLTDMDSDGNIKMNTSRHYYTLDLNDKKVTASAINLSYNQGKFYISTFKTEGIMCYISGSQIEGTVPVYRLYQAQFYDFTYQDQNIHPAYYDQFLTYDANEKLSAQQIYKYTDEGILGYVWSSPK